MLILYLKAGFLGVRNVKNRSLLSVSEDFEHEYNDKRTL